MDDKWKYRFRSIILDRGEEYYYSGLVDDLHEDEDGYHAIVHGTHDYEVDIFMEDDEIIHMECDCPYAEDGDYCKHMATVLFAIEESELSLSVPDDSSQRESLDEILQRLNEDEMRKELSKIIHEDGRYGEHIYQTYRKNKSDDHDVRHIVRLLDCLADGFSDHYGCIDWRNGPDYVNAFEDTFCESIDPMIKRGEIKEAFEVSKEAFRILNQVEMDGSGGEYGVIASCIASRWEEMILSADEQDREKMHQWFKKCRKMQMILPAVTISRKYMRIHSMMRSICSSYWKK